MSVNLGQDCMGDARTGLGKTRFQQKRSARTRIWNRQGLEYGIEQRFKIKKTNGLELGYISDIGVPEECEECDPSL